jgi:NAD(P)-dependent dehydrogenase (short-subunit alcohol dehydrogenase family)
MSPYAAAKHGVVGLTKVASLDYAAKGIRINALAPGPIDTHGFPEPVRQYIGGLLPVGRVGTPAEVAHAAAWLCSDQASFVHGAVLPIDGGRLAGVSNP